MAAQMGAAMYQMILLCGLGVLGVLLAAAAGAIVALGGWGLAPLFERAGDQRCRLPMARVGRRPVDRGPALTWAARGRVALGVVAVGLAGLAARVVMAL